MFIENLWLLFLALSFGLYGFGGSCVYLFGFLLVICLNVLLVCWFVSVVRGFDCCLLFSVLLILNCFFDCLAILPMFWCSLF